MSEERDSEKTEGAHARGDKPAPHEDKTGGERARASEELIVEQRRVVLDEEGLRRRERRRRMASIAVAFVAALAILIIVLVWRTRRKSAETTEETSVVVSVRVAKAEKQAIASQQTVLGTIFPRDTAQVSSKISAQIKQMPLWKNRVVHAGDVIAVLESSDLQSQRNEAVAALNEARASARGIETGTIPQNTAQDEKALRDARAAVDNARRTYQRRQALYQAGGISKKDLEASQLDLTNAENNLRLAEANVSLRTRALNPNDRAQAAARVRQAEQHVGALDAQLSYATVRAPISGVVIEQALYEGSFISSGTTLVTIADVGEVIVKAPFSDTVAAQLKVGDAVTVLPTDLPGEQMTGQVMLISRSVDPASRTVEVWVTLGNEAGRLRVNGAVQVTVSANAKQEAVVVPASAVTLEATNADEGTVMIVDDAQVAHETKVTVGIRTKDLVEITSGLVGGETVVIEGNYSLPDGSKVEISEGDEEKDGDNEGGKKAGDEK
jgi:multidrug efflux pump subunit AcrA (membrane-fusion protein)